jgi:hypothetical protein
MAEGLYLAPPAVGLILAGVLVLALMSSLVFEFSSLGHRRATVVIWGLVVAIWLAAVFVAELTRPGGWW